jgi:hypothetical protein
MSVCDCICSGNSTVDRKVGEHFWRAPPVIVTRDLRSFRFDEAQHFRTQESAAHACGSAKEEFAKPRGEMARRAVYESSSPSAAPGFANSFF